MIKELYERPYNKDKTFEVVYVSSDRSEEEMIQCMRDSHGGWGFIPFNSAERNELKMMFGACAMKEVKELGLKAGERKFGIPTLILIDSKTEEVLSFQGIEEIADASFFQKYEL